MLALTIITLASRLEQLPLSLSEEIMVLAIASSWFQYALTFWLRLVNLRGLPVSVVGMFLTLTPIFGVTGDCSS